MLRLHPIQFVNFSSFHPSAFAVLWISHCSIIPQYITNHCCLSNPYSFLLFFIFDTFYGLNSLVLIFSTIYNFISTSYEILSCFSLYIRFLIVLFQSIIIYLCSKNIDHRFRTHCNTNFRQ
jgi:hypothetical protein